MWFSKRHRIYLDNASATPLCAEAAEAMRNAESLVGNPGAIHQEGVEAKRVLEDSRERVAHEFGVKAREIIFTSGLTEANNIAIIGYARQLERLRRSLTGTHWLVSSIEHDSVLGCFAEIERLGGTVAGVEPDYRGLITPEALKMALKPETAFVSIGWANNEIGTVQPLAKLARVIREHEKEHGTKIVFHTDGGQAPLYEATSIHSLDVDLLSLGSEKLYGPHGVGALYVRNGVEIAKTIFGGAQERGLRAGTENVALAAGFAAALNMITAERAKEAKRLEKLRNELASEIGKRVPDAIVNGDLKYSLPHMLNISIPDIQSEYVTLALDRAGVAISTKSACREGEERSSHVVAALGGEPWRAQNTLRFSLGRDADSKAIDRVVKALLASTSVSK